MGVGEARERDRATRGNGGKQKFIGWWKERGRERRRAPRERSKR